MSETSPLASKVGPVTRAQRAEGLPARAAANRLVWFEAGAVTFAAEARIPREAGGGADLDGWNIYVFGADRSRDWVRFDCSDAAPHYHYLLHGEQKNDIWMFDPDTNGPMLPWALAAISARLPAILRRAGATELAGQVESEGFDRAVLREIERHCRSASDPD